MSLDILWTVWGQLSLRSCLDPGCTCSKSTAAPTFHSLRLIVGLIHFPATARASFHHFTHLSLVFQLGPLLLYVPFQGMFSAQTWGGLSSLSSWAQLLSCKWGEGEGYSRHSWAVLGLSAMAGTWGGCHNLRQVSHFPQKELVLSYDTLGRAKSLRLPGRCGQWPAATHNLVVAAIPGAKSSRPHFPPLALKPTFHHLWNCRPQLAHPPSLAFTKVGSFVLLLGRVRVQS